MSGRRRSRPPGADAAGTSGRASRYGRWTVRWRWQIIAAWVIGLAVLTYLPAIGTGGDQLASVIPLDSPAIQAEKRALHEFGFPLSSRTAVVQRDASGLSVLTQASSVLAAIAVDQGDPPAPLLGALPISNGLGLLGSPGETDTTVLTYLFMDPSSSFASQQAAAQNYVAQNLSYPGDHVVGIAGSIPARAEQARLVTEYLPRLELLTVLAILVLVGLNFRSVVAPLIGLCASAVAFLVTIRLSGSLGALLGVVSPAELEPLLVALLLGVVTDYTIFYVTALQTELAEPRESTDWRDAVGRAIASNTPVIIAAGLTVAAGTAALLAAESAFFRGFGPAMALSVVVGLAVSITLVPALLAVLGPRVFWPRRVSPHRAWPGRVWLGRVWPGRSSARARSALRVAASARLQRLRITDRLTHRGVAGIVLVICVGGLLAASLPLRQLNLGVGFTSSLPATNPVREATNAASDGFAPGITAPSTLLIEGPGVTDDIDALASLQDKLEDEPGVAAILGPAQKLSRRELGIVLAKSGNAARMLVILSSDPLDATAVDDLGRIRDRLPALAAQSGLGDATISIAGDTALAQGLVSSTSSDLHRIALAGITVNLLLLVLFLRALVAPLYLLASSILTLTAALGLTVWLFEDLRGNDGLTFYVPFAAAVLLVALGSDYNIFGVGRVWDSARTRSLPDAIRHAVPESTRAITAAGLTLAVSFGMLAIIPLRPFRELAFAMTIGILLDALVVRSLMMPTMLTLVGPVSGWPGPHLRASRRRKPEQPTP